MPYKNKKDRDFKAEYANYDGTEKVKKRRAMRNAARNKLLKEGKVHKGDGLDVDHRLEMSQGGTNARSNLKAVPASKNRSFARKKDGSRK